MRQLSTVIDDDVQPCIGSLADTDSEAEITILVLTVLFSSSRHGSNTCTFITSAWRTMKMSLDDAGLKPSAILNAVCNGKNELDACA